MGADVSNICSGICGGDDDLFVGPEAQEEERRTQDFKRKEEFVKDVDFKKEKGAFKIELYKSDNGKLLYLFYIRSMELKKIDISSSRDDTFDSSLPEPDPEQPDIIPPDPDPFIYFDKKWNNNVWKLNEKKKILEEVWDLILKNDDDKNKNNKILNKKVLDEIQSKWDKLDNLSKKVYLYKFCVLVGADINYMPGIKNMDMIKRYYRLDKSIDDIEMMKRSCVIL